MGLDVEMNQASINMRSRMLQSVEYLFTKWLSLPYGHRLRKRLMQVQMDSEVRDTSVYEYITDSLRGCWLLVKCCYIVECESLSIDQKNPCII